MLDVEMKGSNTWLGKLAVEPLGAETMSFYVLGINLQVQLVVKLLPSYLGNWQEWYLQHCVRDYEMEITGFWGLNLEEIFSVCWHTVFLRPLLATVRGRVLSEGNFGVSQ